MKRRAMPFTISAAALGLASSVALAASGAPLPQVGSQVAGPDGPAIVGGSATLTKIAAPGEGIAPAAGLPSPSGCAVQPNWAHPSDRVKGAASGDGTTNCILPVAQLTYIPVLFRVIAGVPTPIGDRDGYSYIGNGVRIVGGSSKENPCRSGSIYVSHGSGISIEASGTFTGQKSAPGKTVC